ARGSSTAQGVDAGHAILSGVDGERPFLLGYNRFGGQGRRAGAGDDRGRPAARRPYRRSGADPRVGVRHRAALVPHRVRGVGWLRHAVRERRALVGWRVVTPIILDCDPGHDDAIAIMLAAGDPAVDLLAITTVAGNQTLDKTTLNARRVCTLAGVHDVPIAAGCARPLTRPLQVAADVHGESGLDGPRFGEPAVPVVGEHAVDLVHRLLQEHPEPVTLVPTGPLTNI